MRAEDIDKVGASGEGIDVPITIPPNSVTNAIFLDLKINEAENTVASTTTFVSVDKHLYGRGGIKL